MATSRLITLVLLPFLVSWAAVALPVSSSSHRLILVGGVDQVLGVVLLGSETGWPSQRCKTSYEDD